MIRLVLGVTIGKLVTILLALRGSRGTALPGLIVEKLIPSFLGLARPRLGTVIAITGTNGKTSTQTLLAHCLENIYKNKVLVNSRGANLSRGLVSEICKQLSLRNIISSSGFKYTVLEVEEATLPRICLQIKPDIIVVTNFFRDQLDAYGEVERTKQHVRQAIINSPLSKVIANLDDPQVSDILQSLPNKISGIKIDGHARYIRYEELEGERNLNTDLVKFPSAQINSDLNAEFKFGGIDFQLQLPGYHSYYSFALTYATLKLMDEQLDQKLPQLAAAVQSCSPAFGRGEIIKSIQTNTELQFFLVKNPIGFDLTLEMLKLVSAPNIIIAINDKIADGKDVSWLWDSPLEKVNYPGCKNIILLGTRKLDMQLRLKYAHVNSVVTLCDNISELENLLSALGIDSAKLICTYTAMNQIRDELLSGKRWISSTASQRKTSA